MIEMKEGSGQAIIVWCLILLIGLMICIALGMLAGMISGG